MSTPILSPRSLFAALALSTLCTGARAQSAPSEPASDAPLFTKITATGSGCPAGTWQVSPSADGTSFIVTFRKFTVGLGLSGETGKMDCLLSVALPSRRGWYSLGDVYASAYAQILWNVTARITAKAWFSDAPELGSEDVVDIPMQASDKWFLLHPSRSDAPTRSRCGDQHTLNLRLDVAIEPVPEAKPPLFGANIWVKEMPTDSASGIALTWHPCED